MANKTHATTDSVTAFVAGIEDETQRADSAVLLKMMEDVTKAQPKLWSNGIIGFGSRLVSHHYSKS